MKITKDLNTLTKSEFITIFGSIFEKSEWIAKETFNLKPFKNSKDLVDKMYSADNQLITPADRDLARRAREVLQINNYLGNAECPWIVIMAYLFGLDAILEGILHSLFVFWGGSTVENENVSKLLPWLDWSYEFNKGKF